MTRVQQRLELALSMRERAASMTRTALLMENAGALTRAEAQQLVTAAKQMYATSTTLEQDALAVIGEFS